MILQNKSWTITGTWSIVLSPEWFLGHMLPSTVAHTEQLRKQHVMPTQDASEVCSKLMVFSAQKSWLVGGFNPSEKYSSNWIISPNRGENKKCLKPPVMSIAPCWCCDSFKPPPSWSTHLFVKKNTTPSYDWNCPRVHPGRLTWNIIIEVGKIIFLSKWVIWMFHVNLPGCTWHVPWFQCHNKFHRCLPSQEPSPWCDRPRNQVRKTLIFHVAKNMWTSEEKFGHINISINICKVGP